MIRCRIQIGDGEVVDVYDTYGFIYISSDNIVEAPLKDFDTTRYVEEAGEHIDPRTMQDAFDYNIKFVVEGVNTDIENINEKIAAFNKDIYSFDGDVRTLQKIIFFNDYKRIAVVGYPKTINKLDSLYRRDSFTAQDIAEFTLTIRVTDPSECNWQLYKGRPFARTRISIVKDDSGLRLV